MAAVLLTALLLSLPGSAFAETFIVSAPEDVEDVALRDREFGQWNFGRGLVLEVGFMPGLYEEHHSVSLIRFNLSGLGCGKVLSAKLRLYKPKCSVQTRPVDVHVYEVAFVNCGWAEGSSLCEEEYGASCWRWRGDGEPWVGAEGCAREGIDYVTPELDVQTAPEDRGRWLEFSIPANLVQKWLNEPERNSGLYIKAGNIGERRGDHAFFYSSEHYSGKGPQLVIEGTAGEPRGKRHRKPFNPRYVFPPAGAAFERWLETADNRYVQWTKDANMSREQALMFYYFDITVRGELLLPKCRILLSENMLELDELIAKGDEQAVRQKLKDVRKYLLVWEYIREVRWYDAGPLAEVLSPLQLGILWGKCVFGEMEKKHGKGSWKPLTSNELEQTIINTVEKTREQLELTAEQAKAVDPVVSRCERLEHYYVEKFRVSLAKTQELIRKGADDNEMFECVKQLHMNHELFLYYQSTFNTPRWTVFMDNARAIPLARMYLKARRKEYNPERTARQVIHAQQYSHSVRR